MQNRIKDLLSEKRMAAKSLAEKTGLSSDSIYRIMNGTQEPSMSALRAIASAIGVNVWELLVTHEPTRVNALIQFGGECFSAYSIEDLERITNVLKERGRDSSRPSANVAV